VNAISWICRRVWGWTVLAAVAAGWLIGGAAGWPLALIAFAVIWCALRTERPACPGSPPATDGTPGEDGELDAPDEPELMPLQRAMERAAYRQRTLAELQDSPGAVRWRSNWSAGVGMMSKGTRCVSAEALCEVLGEVILNARFLGDAIDLGEILRVYTA
jgi:hypothetical protein